MAEQRVKIDQPSLYKPGPKVIDEPDKVPGEVTQLVSLLAVPGGNSVKTQARWLGDKRFSRTQRQALASQIARMRGNHYLQGVIAGGNGSDALIRRESTEAMKELGEGVKDVAHADRLKVFVQPGKAAALASNDYPMEELEGLQEKGFNQKNHNILSVSASENVLPARSLANSLVQRQGPKTGPSASSQPSLDEQVRILFENQVKAEIANQARTRMLLCVMTFMDAVNNTMRKEADEEKALKDNPGFFNIIVEMALGALVPGVAAVVLGPLKSQIKTMASTVVEVAMKSKTIDDTDRIAVYLKVDEKIDELAKKVDGASAKKLLDAVTAHQKASLSPGVYKQSSTEAFLVNLKQKMREAAQSTSDSLAGRSLEEITAVWVAYDVKTNTQGVYEGQIRERLADYKEIEKAAQGGSTRIVYIDVWGGHRMCVLKYQPLSIAAFKKATFEFVHYIPPDEEEMARSAAGGNIPTLNVPDYRPGGREYGTTVFIGHIPQPDVETPFIAEVNAWGAPRLAHVAVVGGEPRFIEWVRPEQLEWERQKAQGQPGGLRQYMDRDLRGPIPRPPRS